VLRSVWAEAEDQSSGLGRSAVPHCSLDSTTVCDRSLGLFHTFYLGCTLVEPIVAHGPVGKIDTVDIVDCCFVDYWFVDSIP